MADFVARSVDYTKYNSISDANMKNVLMMGEDNAVRDYNDNMGLKFAQSKQKPVKDITELAKSVQP